MAALFHFNGPMIMMSSEYFCAFLCSEACHNRLHEHEPLPIFACLLRLAGECRLLIDPVPHLQ